MRGVRAFLVCVTVLAVPGCFKHHELDEGTIQPLDQQPQPPVGDGEPDTDGSSDEGPSGDGDQDGDDPEPSSPCAGITDPFASLLCSLLGGGGGAGGLSDLLGGLPTPDECESMPPTNPLGQLLCGGGSDQPPGFEPPSEQDCEEPADPITQFLCDLRDGGDGQGDGADGEPDGGVPGDPGERFRQFLESLLPSAEECAEPADGFVSFICRIFAGPSQDAVGEGDAGPN